MLDAKKICITALEMLTHCNNYIYCLGGQNEEISSNTAKDKAEYYYKDSEYLNYLRNASVTTPKKRIFDCSGLVNYLVGNSRNYTASVYYNKSSSNKNLIRTNRGGSVLTKRTKTGYHCGLDIGMGFFIHIPIEGRTIEIRKISDYDWERSLELTTVNYNNMTGV